MGAGVVSGGQRGGPGGDEVSGKGDTPRPFAVDDKTFSDNWERTFGAKPTAASDQEQSGGKEAGDIRAGEVG